MFQFPREDFRLHVGWRTIKTAVTAILVAVVYCLLERNPAFACIGVIFGLGTDMPDSIKNGGNRLFGTLIGGLLAIVVLILLCQYFWPGGVQPGGVVLCIVLFSTPVETYVAYALNRIFDTAVGVIVALLVNYFLPRERVVACWEKVKGLFRPLEHS
ncbi:FUSC family protein [Faecalibacterium sp.]|uniref:FUSC family protein n=1 Tax=Faecalibacterium sp. TaxID=1971605 RepID=UPI003991DE33